MKPFRNSIFYILIIGGFSTLLYWIILSGMQLEQGRDIVATPTENNHWNGFVKVFIANLNSPLALLLAQMIAILSVAKLFGWLCKKMNQPSVIGEMIAGIVLGPSLFGLYFPEAFNTLFPQSSLGALKFLSQIGLILFMFIVGMELDLSVLKNKAKDAVIISHASIIIPFT
ncbi:MAG TPA: cation:proton antiporter, partial [Chitinophagales bacterium]